MQTYYTVVKPSQLESLGFKRVTNFKFRYEANGKHMDCWCDYHFTLCGNLRSKGIKELLEKMITEGIVTKEYREDYVSYFDLTSCSVVPHNGYNWNDDMYSFMKNLLSPLGNVGRHIAMKLYMKDNFVDLENNITLDDCEQTLFHFASISNCHSLM